MEAYCVKCRSKREMSNPQAITMKNGRPATQGVCPICSTKMFQDRQGCLVRRAPEFTASVAGGLIEQRAIALRGDPIACMNSDAGPFAFPASGTDGMR